MKSTQELIKDFIIEKYGKSELSTMKYKIEELADYIDSHNEFGQEVRNWINAETYWEIEHNQSEYYICTTNGGYGYEGCAKNEDIYDEKKARENVIDNLEVLDIFNSESAYKKFIELVKYYIW